MRINVAIAQSDHDDAESCFSGPIDRCHTCPIAQAMLRRGYTKINVNGVTIRFRDEKNRAWIASLPPKARDFVSDVDSRPESAQKKFSFTLYARPRVF